MRGRAVIRSVIVLLLAILPSYSVERFTEYSFLTSSPDFFTWSGLRIELFISSILLAAIIAGFLLDRLSVAVAVYTSGILILLSLFFVFCMPRVCYNAGPDGLEPLRMGYFFSCLGLVGVSSGNFLQTRREVGGLASIVLSIAVFTSVAYYPVMFSLAGARLIGLLDPLPLLLVVGLMSFWVTARVAEKGGRARGVLSSLLASLLLLGIASGIAKQYFSVILPDIVLVLVATVAGSLLAVTAAKSRPAFVSRRFVRSSRPIFLAFVIVLIMMVVILPDAVSGVMPRQTGSSTLSIGRMFGSPSFVGGLMAQSFLRPKGVSVVVSFAGTNSTSIQADNFLSAGIGVHSPNCCVDGIDYGYRFDAYLLHSGSEILAASGWEVCDFNMACGGHSWLNLMFFSVSPVVAPSSSSSLRLTMQWKNRTVYWSYSFADSAPVNLTSFRAPAQENPYFNAGSLANVLSNPESAGTFFFQFGIMSKYPIGHAGWRVGFACPAYLEKGAWVCITHALSLQGDQSYWKALWRWGENYQGVTAVADAKNSSVTFSYSPSTLPDFQRFW